jgi:FkbM family methyltransferase
MGFMFAGSPSMMDGTFEPTETRLFLSLLRETDVLVNVGANVGYYSCLALAHGKPVMAFEPVPENVQALYKNVRANGWQDSIEILPVALSDRPGIVEIFGAGTGASLVPGWADISERFVSSVAASTLDNLAGTRFSGKRLLILMDVEGSELHVLRGATRMLSRDPRPRWMVEISVGAHQPKGISVNPNLMETFQVFWNAGYEVSTATDTPRKVAPDEVRAIAGGGPDTLGTHNFVFT